MKLNSQQFFGMGGFMPKQWGFIVPFSTEVVPPYFEDLVQWLKGDTFEDSGTTYMRDYSGNDFHAIVIDADTIIQPASNTDLYNADLLQNGYFYTNLTTPKNIDIADLNYEVYDATPYYGVTFADISEGTFKNILTYATAKDNYEKADVLGFVNGNTLLLDSEGISLTDSGGNQLYGRKI